MAYIVQNDVVHYACSCGLLKPISKLYFCRHCLQMRCGFCVCHEVDSHFCGKCAENIPSSEARLKKNRCSSCYDCPCCQHQLSIRVSSAGGPKAAAAATGETKAPTPRKVYYLACSFCRWNTRDVGIPDQSVATGGWPERENVHAARLTAIQDKYKALVLWDKQQRLDKEKKKHLVRGRYLTMTDKTGLTAAMIRKRVGLPELPAGAPPPSKATGARDPAPPATALASFEPLAAEVWTQPLQLDEVTSLEQRLLQPDWQPESTALLFPLHKHLAVKRSLRCRACEHNVSKPEYNPNSIKFKIQLFAFYHIPEVRLVTVEPLRAGCVSELIVKLCNPTQHQTTVTLLPADGQGDEEANAAVELPEDEGVAVVLPPRDDAAEYDDSSDAHGFQDDPRLVVWRKANKAALKLRVTPGAALPLGRPVRVACVMRHGYVNTIASADGKEPQRCDHQVRLLLSLGNIVGSA